MEFNLISENQAPRSNKKIVGFALLAVAAVAACAIAFVATPAKQQTVGLIAEQEQNEQWVLNAFQNWSNKFEKVYGSSDEKNYRVQVFRQNFLKIKEFYEEGKKSFSVGLNEFSDLTQEEFRAKYLTLVLETPERNDVSLSTEGLPESVNWVEAGVVNSVKNQGQCGSCWAFSAIAAVEALHAIKTREVTRFSEQQLVDCSGGSYGNEGCNGGLMDPAFQYIIDNGIELESSYPYRGQDQKCKHSESKTAWTFSGIGNVPEKDLDQLKAAAAQQVVSVAIEVNFEFQFYSGGVFESDESCGESLNHGVALVGYGTENKKDFWLVRNSWGGSWGDKGYIKMARKGSKGQGTCGIALVASYPLA